MKKTLAAAAFAFSFVLVAAPAFSADKALVGQKAAVGAKPDRSVKVGSQTREIAVKKGETIVFAVESMPMQSASIGAGKPSPGPHQFMWVFDGSDPNIDFNEIDPTVPAGLIVLRVK